MGQGRWRTGMMAVWVGLVAGAAALVTGGAMLWANAPAPVADNAVQAPPFEAYAPIEPVSRATADMASPVLQPGADPQQAWLRPAAGAQRMVSPMLYDNGMPLEDFGQPASQLSLCLDECAVSRPGDSIPCNVIPGNFLCLSSGMIRPEFFSLSAASADDFILAPGAPGTNFQITMIRAAFVFFPDTATPAPDPMTTWTGGIHVTVYANSVLNAPDGVPNGDGTFAGNVIATQLVPLGSFASTLTGGCVPYWVVDIPVSFALAGDTRYWLSLVPQHPVPPQSFWCLSQSNTGFFAHQGADIGPAFWAEILGNDETSGCTPPPPPAFTMKDLSFQIHGSNLPSANDDCANAILLTSGTIQFDTRGNTTDGPPDPIGAPCTDVNQDIWFQYVATCDGQMIVSLCLGTDYDAALAVYDGCACTPLGPLLACDDDFCGVGGAAAVTTAVVRGNCYLIRVGGAGSAVGTGTLTIHCVPTVACCPGDTNNDGLLDDLDATALIMDLLNPPLAGTPAFCRADVNDDGAVNGLDIQALVDLLLSGAVCPPPVTGACCFSDQTCVEDAVDGCFFAGGIYQGDGTACTANTCQLTVTGACCLADGTCLQFTDVACLAAIGIYQGDDTLCTPNLCPLPLLVECCLGDVNADDIVDTLDVPGFVAALLNPPPLETPDACRADINMDLSVDGEDISGFVALVLSQTACPLPANDNCANARLLSCNTRLAVDNSLATTAVGDPNYSCRINGPGQGVGTLWFSFVAIDTTALVSTCNSFSPANDTILAVYDVSCPTAADEIACSEDDCGRLSQVCVSGLTIGQTYVVQVSSFDASNQGFITLEITCPCP